MGYTDAAEFVCAADTNVTERYSEKKTWAMWMYLPLFLTVRLLAYFVYIVSEVDIDSPHQFSGVCWYQFQHRKRLNRKEWKWSGIFPNFE